jgi:regulator of protease activity HflC (stomatin/prohibitin superfamily)
MLVHHHVYDTRSFGLTVFRYEVTDIIPDHNISRAMDLQAAAEREKRQVRMSMFEFCFDMCISN